jgi:hypothetical protein
MEWTMPTESRIGEYAGYAGGAYPKKRRRVLLVILPQSSISPQRKIYINIKREREREREYCDL